MVAYKSFCCHLPQRLLTALLASLLVALTLVPVMSAGLLKNTQLREHKPAMRFPKMVTWSLNHKWIVFTISILLLIGSVATYFAIPKGAVDNSSADYVVATLSYPNETPIEKVREKAFELETSISNIDEVDYLFTQVGSPSEAAQYGSIRPATEATFSIFLNNKEDTDKVIKELEKEKDDYTDATFEVIAASFIMMGSGGTNITIDVMGENLPDLEETATAIKEKVEDIEGVEKVTTNQDEKKTVYSLVVDPTKGNTEQVAQQLGVMLNNTPIGTMNLDDRQTLVILEPVLDTKTPEDLKNIPIMTSTGLVPVSQLATSKEETTTTQFHKDGEPYLQVTASVDPTKLSEIAKKIHQEIFGDTSGTGGINIPENVEVAIGGASAQQAEDFTDLFLIMLASIGIVFLIMVITFKSIKAPIAILCSLPLAAIGAILGIVISGISVDITALLVH